MDESPGSLNKYSKLLVKACRLLPGSVEIGLFSMGGKGSGSSGQHGNEG